jgi:hypothetical protein
MISPADDWATPFDYHAASARTGKRARDTSLDAAANGWADIRDAPYLGGQCCGNHESGGDSATHRKLAEQENKSPCQRQHKCAGMKKPRGSGAS